MPGTKLENPAPTQQQQKTGFQSCYLQGLESKRSPALRSEIKAISFREVCCPHLFLTYWLPDKCLFAQPDLLLGASSKNWHFGSSFENSCLLGSQHGEQSKSLEAEDGKLCHWKKKIPITGVGYSQHHNLRALLKLHWSPWPAVDQKLLKRYLVYLAEPVPSYATWLQH